MSAYAPFYDSQGRFVGVTGVDIWVRDFDARVGAIRRAGIGALAAVAMLSVLAGFVVYRLSRTASRARRRDRIVQARLADAKQQAEIQAQRAEAASRAKSDFLAMMSHEIPHADEWRAGFRQSAARDAAQCRAAGIRPVGAALGRCIAHHHSTTCSITRRSKRAG